MAIVFDSEGGFREVPDPPKPSFKHYSYHIHGPSLAELFKGLKLYPAKKVRFDISPSSIHGHQYELISAACCEVLIYELGILLVPMKPGDRVTIDRIENVWNGHGFVETVWGFMAVSFYYNTKKRDGILYFSIKEDEKR